MGWLNKIFSKGKRDPNAVMNLNVSMKGYEPTFTSFGKNILQSDIIYSALKMKARFFGKLDPRHIRIKQGQDKGGHTTELVTDSSVARILRKPNDFQTTYDFLTQAYFMREKDDNCFIYPDYYTSSNGTRIYTGMYVLLPIMTPIIEQDQSGKLYIRFQFVNPSREVVFPLQDIIVWRQNLEDNQFIGGGRYAGLSNVDLLNSLQAYHQSKEAVAEAAKLGCYLDGIIKVNAYAADNKDTQKIRDQFIQDLKTNKSGIGVLDNGAEYQDIQRSLKMVDAATLAEIKQNVMLHTGMTMDMLMGKFTAEEKEAFYENWIEPAAISLGQAMSKVFFSQWQTSYGDQVQLYPKKIQLMSTSEITNVVQNTINAGLFMIDEYREMYGYPPLPNGEGLARPRGFNHLDGENGDQQQQFVIDPNERNLRFNENHSPKDGKFVDGHGHHGHDQKGANAHYDSYSYSSDIDENQPSISYDKQIDTYSKKKAVETYTSGKDELLNYDNINKYLNGKKEFSADEQKKLDEIINTLDSCFEGRTDKNMYVYRGISLKASDLSVGDVIENNGYTSTSAIKNIANDFAEHYKGTTLELQVKKGTKALGIGYHTTGEFDEAEILFPRGSKIKILEVNENGAKGVIENE